MPGTRLGVDGNCEASLFDDLPREPAIFSNHSARPNTVIEHWPRMGSRAAGPGATEGQRHRLEQDGLLLTTYHLLCLLLTTTDYYLLLTTSCSLLTALPTAYCYYLLLRLDQEGGTLWLVATEEIAQGQEIRFDYERGERGAY